MGIGVTQSVTLLHWVIVVLTVPLHLCCVEQKGVVPSFLHSFIP